MGFGANYKKNWLISHAGFLAVIKIGWVLVSEKND
jgi:hypothetical protein